MKNIRKSENQNQIFELLCSSTETDNLKNEQHKMLLNMLPLSFRQILAMQKRDLKSEYKLIQNKASKLSSAQRALIEKRVNIIENLKEAAKDAKAVKATKENVDKEAVVNDSKPKKTSKPRKVQTVK